MSVHKHLFVVPITTMSRKEFSRLLLDQYDFLDEDFVLRNAFQLWVDYCQDPDGQWHSNVEDEVHREYGGTLNKMAGKMTFREGRGQSLKDQIMYKNELVDNLASEVAKHISLVSSYVTGLMDEDELEDIVLSSEFEILVTDARFRGRSVKVVVEEL
jgi:hypothetical protein